MLRKTNIICISSIDWDFIRQGHQEIMSTLAAGGNMVLFIENTGVRAPNLQDLPRLKKRVFNWMRSIRGIRKENDNLYIYSPLIIPFPYSKIATKINKFLMLSAIKRWMKVMEFHNPIVWSFLPTPIALEILDELDPRMFIYYCIDDFVSSSKGASRIRKTEEAAIRRSDLVFATSHRIYDRCRLLNKDTYLFPFGINVDNYNTARERSITMPEELRHIRRPIIGYIGGMHKWIDMKLIRGIALARKDMSIVMVGPKQTDLDDITGLSNVFILGKKEYHELPAYAKFFDAGIIPYKITKYTENVYPTKINEYLAMGKPVISTRIPEVVEIDKASGGNFIYFIESPDDIDRVMKIALSEDNRAAIEKRIEVANSNSWERRIGQMCDLIEKKSREIALEITHSWAERLKRVYSRVRRRAVKTALAIGLLYLAVFHTGLVWTAAGPLRIAETPRRSDCIVVLAGGVGESGKSAQGYEERVEYGVWLYKKGLAGHLIFSSGYKNVFDETMVMKSLSVTLGVPKDAVILENSARNTYENVKFTAEIIKSRGWASALLITSPYHALRTSLVFKRQAPDIIVTYTPLPNSQFYRHDTKSILRRQVTVKQIIGILHEYLGILYYKFKGWI